MTAEYCTWPLPVPLDALHSTIGRHAARAVMCAMNVDILEKRGADSPLTDGIEVP